MEAPATGSFFSLRTIPERSWSVDFLGIGMISLIAEILLASSLFLSSYKIIRLPTAL
jgi:hypothetical protein